MQIKELREKSIAELYKHLNNVKNEYNILVLTIKSGKSSDLTKKRALKKDISRIKTIISEKEVINTNEKI